MRPRLLLLLLALVATPVAAQGVRGVIVTRDTVAVSGAVVALIDSLGSVGATVLSDEFGRFDLRAPRRGEWRVRVEAVGFARVLSLPMTLASAEIEERVIHLVDATRRLGAVEVRDRNACDIRPAEGSQVALLWDEARKSLEAAALSADRSTLLAFDFDEIEYDSTLSRVRSASRRTIAGRAEQGFRSDAPKALRELGYARRIDTTSTYLGPDARVLLSAEFAATHCFRLVDDDPTSVRRVGLAFAPVTVPTSKLEVAGVLWIDRETFVLDRVEFRYVPTLSADHPDSTFGGRVQFRRLASGHVIVSQWVLRMPLYAEESDQRLARAGQTSQMLIRPERRERIAGLKVARGAVRAFDAPPEPLPTVTLAPRRAVGPPSCEGVAPMGGNSGAIVGDVHDARDRGMSGARVRATWHQDVGTGGRLVFREQWVESGTDAQGRYALCALPRGVPLSIEARRATATSAASRVFLAPGAPVALDLELVQAPRARSASAAAQTGAIHGRLLGTGDRPLVGVPIRVFPGRETVTTDSLGEFHVEALAPGLRDFFVRRVGYAPTMLSIEVAAGDTARVIVPLASSAQSLAPVVVEARVTSLNLAGFELRREQRVGGGQFISRDEIRAREASTIQSLLRTFGRVWVEESAETGDIRV
ncbi:MAG: carboxypeptidase regulatory-like domain-containing protein, partial [Gemmatimonadaceae bacterium]|nr:carboxypeptidase regulatory-like domain-containing protein [Gemmatimonadaceae bacterium]